MALKDQVNAIKGIVAALFDGTNVLAGQASRIGNGIDALQVKVAELKALLTQGPQPVDAETQAALNAIEAMAGASKARLDTLAANLEAIGADAEAPIPDPAPLPGDEEQEGDAGGPEEDGGAGSEDE